jgi:hypothetical protein
LVTAVEGQVLYGAGDAIPLQSVKAGQKLGPGQFSVGNDGILFLSSFDGSELRLGESGTLTYDGDDHLCRMDGPGMNLRSNFHLKQGKLQITIRFAAQPPHCYHVLLKHGQASMANGQCVMCMHGDGTYLYVARGSLAVSGDTEPEANPVAEGEPIYGAKPGTVPTLKPLQPDRTQLLVGNGQVGVVSVDGGMRMQPLSALAAGTQTCLLSNLEPNVVEGGGGMKSTGPDTSGPPTNGPPGHFPRRFVVSPTQ